MFALSVIAFCLLSTMVQEASALTLKVKKRGDGDDGGDGGGLGGALAGLFGGAGGAGGAAGGDDGADDDPNMVGKKKKAASGTGGIDVSGAEKAMESGGSAGLISMLKAMRAASGGSGGAKIIKGSNGNDMYDFRDLDDATTTKMPEKVEQPTFAPLVQAAMDKEKFDVKASVMPSLGKGGMLSPEAMNALIANSAKNNIGAAPTAGNKLVVWPPAPQAVAAPTAMLVQAAMPIAQFSTAAATSASASGLYQGLAAMRANLDAIMGQASPSGGVNVNAVEAKLNQMSEKIAIEGRKMEAKIDGLESAHSVMEKQLQEQAQELKTFESGDDTHKVKGGKSSANASTYATEPWDATFHVHLDPEDRGVDEDDEAQQEDAFTLRVHPEWAPEAAKRFQDMVHSGVLNDARFFRVIPGFMVQWGIPADPKVGAEWIKKKIQDDPVIKSNTRGMVSFAMAGPNTRTTQMFINYGNNAAKLDQKGFAPFAEVLGKGMKTVGKIHANYQERPKQDKIWHDGNKYLQKHFPKLSFIGHVDSTLIDPLRKKASEELKIKKKKKKPVDSEDDDDDI